MSESEELERRGQTSPGKYATTLFCPEVSPEGTSLAYDLAGKEDIAFLHTPTVRLYYLSHVCIACCFFIKQAVAAIFYPYSSKRNYFGMLAHLYTRDRCLTSPRWDRESHLRPFEKRRVHLRFSRTASQRKNIHGKP